MKAKNQHYIPQFHLRRWSADGKLISLYNRNNHIFVDNKGAIKNLASRNYFYDEDGSVEKHLSAIESQVAPVYHKIIESESLTELTEEEIGLLYLHIALFNERTAAAGEDYEKLVKEQVQVALKLYQAHGQYMDIDTNAIKDNIKVQFQCSNSIKNGIMSSPLIGDLNLALIKNTSEVEFLTSDYPVIRYNLWSLIRNLNSGWGISSVGIMFILPIAPKFALIAYDSMVYRIRKLRNNTVSIKNKADINELNSLMLINANENLFFSKNIPQHYINNLLSRINSYIKPHNPVSVVENSDSFYIINTVRKISYKANLKFISITSESLKWIVPRDARGLIRPSSEAIAKILEEEMILFDKDEE